MYFGTYLYQKKISHCLSKVQLGILYFYLLDLATLADITANPFLNPVSTSKYTDIVTLIIPMKNQSTL